MRMMSRCLTWFPIGGYRIYQYITSICLFYKNMGSLLGGCLTVKKWPPANGLVECLLNRPCPQSYAPVWAACGSKLAWRQVWWNTKRLLFWFRYSRRLVWAFGIAWKMLQGKENDWWIWTCLWWWKNILTIGGCNGIKSSLWKEKGYSWKKLLWKLLTKNQNRRAVSKQWR